MANGSGSGGGVTVLPPDDLGEAQALVLSGATIMKVENETMSAVSVARPRNEKTVLEGAIAELELYPDLAASNFYSIPYGESRGSDRKVLVEGPSIHAALALARRWGNCVTRSMQVGEDEEKVYLSGVFLDLETNFRVERPFTVSKLFRHRDNRVEALREQRLIQAIQSGASKSIRNAILAGLPRGFVETFYRRARAIAEREAKTTWSKLLEAFREFGVTKEMIEANIGRPIEKITDSEIVDLRGIYNAIKEGATTTGEAFARRDTKGKDETGTVDDILGGGAEVTGGAEKPLPPATEEVRIGGGRRDAESPSETPASSPESTDRGESDPNGEEVRIEFAPAPPVRTDTREHELEPAAEPSQGTLSEKSGEDWF